MLPQFTFALVPILASLPSVTAHGYVSKVVIDGTTYTGPLPADAAGATNNSPSPIRQIADIGPVKGATNPDINCGLSAQLASLVVPANPGSSMEFYWGNPSGGHVSRDFHFFALPWLTHHAVATCDWSINDVYGLVRYLNMRQVQWFYRQVVQNRRDWQGVRWEHLVPTGCRCVAHLFHRNTAY
jgi:hypothetical protein